MKAPEIKRFRVMVHIPVEVWAVNEEHSIVEAKSALEPVEKACTYFGRIVTHSDDWDYDTEENLS